MHTTLRGNTMGMSGPESVHLVVAVALAYLLGFERDVRGAPTGDRVFEIRHIRWLSLLDGRRWARYFPNDDGTMPSDEPTDEPDGH